MIRINEFSVGAIPQLLLYFVPGYTAIIVYRSITSTKAKHEHTLWVSCVISYVAVTLVKVFWPANSTVIPELLALITCVVTTLAAVSFGMLVQWQRFAQFLGRFLHYNPSPSVLAGHVKLTKPGTMARVYINDSKFYVEGSLSNYSNSTDDPYISLKWYSFFELNSPEPYYECKNDDKYFIISMNNIQHIEVWPTPTKK